MWTTRVSPIQHPPRPRSNTSSSPVDSGCGKSTELLRTAAFLHHPDRYYVIPLDCLEKLDINNLEYPDVLLALAAALLERLEQEEGIIIDYVFLSRLENWFTKRVEVHNTALRDFAAEVKAGAKMQTGLLWLGKLFKELTSKINVGSSYREELRLIVRNNFTEFAEAFNQLILASEEKIRSADKGKRILFTVDGTDRLDQKDAPKFFVEDVHQLTQINGLFIYCAPVHLLHQVPTPLTPVSVSLFACPCSGFGIGMVKTCRKILR